MKLISLTKLLVRFSRIKIKKAKKAFRVCLGDNYPIIAINQKFSFK